jgi:hypothetical protein
LLWDEKIEQKMAEEDDYDLESRPSRSVSAMAIEFEPDLEAPLLASVGAKPQSRLAPLLVLFGQFKISATSHRCNLMRLKFFQEFLN